MGPRLRAASAVLLLLAPVLSRAASVPEVDFQVVPYPVRGRSLAEVQADMARQAPSKNDESYYAGLTTWDLRSTYDLVPTSEGCLIDNGQVFLRVRVHLPQLVDSQRLTAGAVREWRRFSAALHGHEMLHAQNAHRAAVTLLSKLNGRRTDILCESARGVVERGTAVLMQRISQFDRELDAHSHHGATQGAQLATDRR